MKYLLLINLVFFSLFSFCQNFGTKEREALVLRSLKSNGFVTKGTSDWPVIYVLVDTMEEHIQNFIKEKFPKKNWRFFDIKECQVIFKDIAADSLVPGFYINSWKYKEAYYFDFVFCFFSHFWHSSDRGNMPIQPGTMCGDLPTGRLLYNRKKNKWEFADQKQLYKEQRKGLY